jgi:hypothetical protein
VFEKRVLRNILGPKKKVVTGYTNRLHNVEIREFYSSSNIRLIKPGRKR